MSSKTAIVSLATISLIALGTSVAPAKVVADRVAFEQAVATLASEVNIPKPIAHLVSVGEFYCELKKAAKEKPPTVLAAYVEYRKSHSAETPDHDTVVSERAAMDEAGKFLCPDS
jgi:hypothetical protein